MQKQCIFEAYDSKSIYGTLDSQATNDSERTKLIIFVHGLTGHKDEPHYFNAVPYFNQRGYDTFRFNLYSDEPNSRNLSDCSISIHTKDLITVVSQFKEKYSNINLIGHSLGAVSVIESRLDCVSKIVLWDPSRGMRSLEEKGCSFNGAIGKYVLDWQMEILLGEDMIKDWQEASNIPNLISKINKPCKLIFADKSELYKSWVPYINEIKTLHSYKIISGASHTFIEEGVLDELYKETLDWIQD